MEIRIPNNKENLVKAYNIAEMLGDLKLEVQVTDKWIIIKQPEEKEKEKSHPGSN